MGNDFVCTVPLLLLVLAFGACFINNTKVRTATEAVGAFLFLFLFLGCREITVINDTFFNYCLLEQLGNLDFIDRWKEMHSHEKMILYGPLYHLYMLALTIVSSNPYTVVVAGAAIGVGVSVWLIKKLSPMPAVTAFILWLPIIQVVSTFRQTIAIAIFFVALYTLIRRKQLWVYLVLTVLAAMFHKSAIILLPLPWLMKIKVDWPTAAIVVACFMVAGLLVFELADVTGFTDHVYVQKSLDRLFYPGAFIFGVMMAVFTAAAMWLRNRMGVHCDTTTNILLWCALLCVGGYLLGSRISELHRLAWYFTIPAVVGFVRIAATASQRALKAGGLMIALLALAFYAYFLMVCLWRPEWYNLTPYSFIFA